MDILHIIGSICSIGGLVFAVIVYTKSKNIKSEPSAGTERLIVFGVIPLDVTCPIAATVLGFAAG
ncbi:MAG: hypothetical protein LUE06_00505 [Oscillospiraceae bacterium]|nr:hypothetical protein [Oscillospiraceae bacterium]